MARVSFEVIHRVLAGRPFEQGAANRLGRGGRSAGPLSSVPRKPMKITDIKTAVVVYHGQATLIRIDTDIGISGYGGANPNAGAAAIVDLISELKPERFGEDPRNVESCWEKIRRKHVFFRCTIGHLSDRAQRHRNGTLGSRSQGGGSTIVPHVRWQVPRPHPPLR